LEPPYYPRPIHRPDRATSGLVLLAKTKDAMRLFSSFFASRRVTKTYWTLVRWQEPDKSSSFRNSLDAEKGRWMIIDCPIDGRDSVNHWRRQSKVQSSTNETNGLGPYALLEVRPLHGRNHQIRRHLSYCLGTPIIGDAKYDKGARHERLNGMYLCCSSLEFPYPDLW